MVCYTDDDNLQKIQYDGLQLKNRKEWRPQKRCTLEVNRKLVEQVRHFKNFGVALTNSENPGREVKKQIDKAVVMNDIGM